MKGKFIAGLVLAGTLFGYAGTTQATIIDFTGGTAYLQGGGTVVTSNAGTAQGVDYYTEDGFTLDFIGDMTSSFTSIIGDYYGGNNDVIHGHWATGDYGGLTAIAVTKNDGTAFDLNYFILTSNTDTGGSLASGFEQAYITASNGFSYLLPSDDWGWAGPNTQVWLPSQFDNITSFTFTVANAVDCFGMDMFYIDEPAPTPDPNAVPEPGTLLLLGAGMAGLAGVRRFKKS